MAQQGEAGSVYRLLRGLIDVRPAEVRALGWSWLYIFCVFVSYYILRPIRDDMGVAGGVENLQWLFTGTLLGMIVVNPPFAALVAKLPRVRFIAITYRFFIVNLLIFILLFHMATAAQHIWVGRVFFIWTSVFNLFVVSVFWALMVDVFDSEQGKRLFGFIAAGATLGGIAGSSITASLAKDVPATYLLLGSAVLLEAAVFSVRRLSAFVRCIAPAARSAERQGAHRRERVFRSNPCLQVTVFNQHECVYAALRDYLDAALLPTTGDCASEFCRARRAYCLLRPHRSLGQYPHVDRPAFSYRPCPSDSSAWPLPWQFCRP